MHHTNPNGCRVGDFVVSELTGRKGHIVQLNESSGRAVVETKDGGITECDSASLSLTTPDYSETERLEWIFRQGEDFSCTVLQDQPGDGNYRVTGMDGEGEGATPREALDAAMSVRLRKAAATNAGQDFARGITAFMRKDPDVIVKDEVRDTETARPDASGSASAEHLELVKRQRMTAPPVRMTPNQLLDALAQEDLQEFNYIRLATCDALLGNVSHALSRLRTYSHLLRKHDTILNDLVAGRVLPPVQMPNMARGSGGWRS